MSEKLYRFKNPISVISAASVVGKEEKDGPLGSKFDYFCEDNRFEKPSWEQSEGEMQRIALNTALEKCNMSSDGLDAVFAGDLINQCTGSSFGLLDFDVPYFGIYGACSTCAQGLILASVLCDSYHANRCAAVTSSHFCTAERQFRYPLEYASLSKPTSQHTATASGAFILSREKGDAHIVSAMGGISTDMGITDANNMGAAMAPAAIGTLLRFFEATNTKPDDYSKIITGDLGNEGYNIVLEFMSDKGYDMQKVYTDCGLLLYDRKKQNMLAGASGCGCSASILASHFLPMVRSGESDNILFIGTGALLSQKSAGQGLSIPAIAHLVNIRRSL